MEQKRLNQGNTGRKNKYFSHVEPRLEEIKHWCRQGLTEAEICQRLDVSVSSFSEYKKKFSELLEALKVNKEIADNRVEDSLYMRALGYEYVEETLERIDFPELRQINGQWVDHEMRVVKRVVKKQAPDTTAQIFWLKNRKPDAWRDKQNIEHSGEMTNNIDLSGISMKELKNLAAAFDEEEDD